LDLDGVLSNSKQALAELSLRSHGAHHTLEYVPLAAKQSDSRVGMTAAGSSGSRGSRSGSSSGRSESSRGDELPTAEVLAAVAAARGKLVYVGSAGGLGSKQALVALLAAAANATLPLADANADAGVASAGTAAGALAGAAAAPPPPVPPVPLVIFGARWGLEPQWAPYWAGVLPHEPGALAAVYESAFAVRSTSTRARI
jgi:hypothetical protein